MSRTLDGCTAEPKVLGFVLIVNRKVTAVFLLRKHLNRETKGSVERAVLLLDIGIKNWCRQSDRLLEIQS